MKYWFGKGWAAPVLKKRWAFIATVTWNLMRLSGFKHFSYIQHRAWERAVGVERI